MIDTPLILNELQYDRTEMIDRIKRLHCGVNAIGRFDIVCGMVAAPHATGIQTDLVSRAIRYEKLLE